MLTIKNGIVENLLRPADIYFFYKTGTRMYEVAKKVAEKWNMLIPNQIQCELGIFEHSCLSYIVNGTWHKGNDSTDSRRAYLKTVLRGRYCNLYQGMYDHIHEMVWDNAAINSYLRSRNEITQYIAGRTLQEYKSCEKENINNVYCEILEKLKVVLKDQYIEITSDKRISKSFKEYILANIDVNPEQILAIIVLLSLFFKNDDDKDFYAEFESHYTEKTMTVISRSYDAESSERISSFEEELFEKSKTLIRSWEEEQDYEIDPALLASCTVKGEEYSTLFEYVNKAINTTLHKNCIVEATGGSGKTSSLVYTCKKFLDNADSVIPIFVQMRKIDETLERPIRSYIYNNYVGEMDISTPSELESRFFQKLGAYLKDNDKYLLIVLDGCNETSRKSLKGLNDFVILPNTIIIASSRLRDNKMNEFVSISLHSLDRDSAKQYLSKFDLSLERDFDNENLRLPIFIYMLAQICRDKTNSQEKIVGLVSQATIISEWIANDLEESKKINAFEDETIVFTIKYFLPLLAMEMFFNTSAKEHSTLYVSKEKCLKAIKGVNRLLQDEELRSSIEVDFTSIDKFDLNKCLTDKVIERFAFLQREVNDGVVFCWSHECYRDWFAAQGMYLLKQQSKQLATQYVKKFVDGPFKYPEAFNNNDYAAYSVAVFFAEQVGEKLVTENDISYHQLIRNIAYYADDVGNVKNVMDYTDYILKRDSNANIETPKYQKAHALSGMAYTLLHIYNLTDRSDSVQIFEKASKMLYEAKKDLVELTGVSFDEIDIDAEMLTEFSPQKLAEFYDEMLACEQIQNIDSLLQKDNLDFDVYDTMALYARLYGNFGSYYVNRYDAEKDPILLVEAYNTHLIGGLIKHYLLKKKPNEKVSGNSTSAAMALTYRSLGIDLYRNKQYLNSAEYLEYAKTQFENSEKDSILLDAYIIRSGVADILENNHKGDLLPLIMDEKTVVKRLKKKRMIGGLERTTEVVFDMITICKKYSQSQNVESELTELINLLDNVYDALSIEDNLGSKLLDYWKCDELPEAIIRK